MKYRLTYFYRFKQRKNIQIISQKIEDFNLDILEATVLIIKNGTP